MAGQVSGLSLSLLGLTFEGPCETRDHLLIAAAAACSRGFFLLLSPVVTRTRMYPAAQQKML
jgi:hypothetical protein